MDSHHRRPGNPPPLYILSYTAYRYKVIYYLHRIKPVPVAGREAHIHLCLVSVVRSSTSGPLVASDTDSSPAPSSQPSSLQFVAVGIRRPRRQSYVVFQSVKEPLSFHSLWKERDSNPRCPTLFHRLSEAFNSIFSGYSSVAFDHSAILPFLVLCLALFRKVSLP